MSAAEPISEDDQNKENNNDRPECRNAECDKKFSSRSNRDRHEKQFGHTPAPRRNAIQIPIFSEELGESRCPLQNCSVTSKNKSNITWHIKAGCETLSKRKVENKVCPHCKETFAQKSNRDRHVERFHPITEPILSQADLMDTELQVPTLDDNMAQVMNVSFLNDDGSLLELSMTMIDEETPIFQVFEPALNSSFVEGQEPECQGFSSSSMTFESESTTFPHDSATIPSETTTHQSESTTFPRDSATIPSETPGIMPTPRSSGVFSIAVQDDDSDPDNQFNFSKELEDRAKQREVDHELQFKYKVLNKLKMDIKSHTSKRSAAKFLFESFGDRIE